MSDTCFDGTLRAVLAGMNKRRRYKAKRRRALARHSHFLRLQRMIQMFGRMYRGTSRYVPPDLTRQGPDYGAMWQRFARDHAEELKHAKTVVLDREN